MMTKKPGPKSLAMTRPMSGAAYIRTLIDASMLWRHRLKIQGIIDLIDSGQVPEEQEKIDSILVTFAELIRTVYQDDIHYLRDGN